MASIIAVIWDCDKTLIDEGPLIITLFDKKFSDEKISDVKKIDFVLWQYR